MLYSEPSTLTGVPLICSSGEGQPLLNNGSPARRALTVVSSPRFSPYTLRSQSSRRGSLLPAAGELSTTGAIYTILNIFVGLGLLSKPYAIAQSGLIGILGLAFICFVSCQTGKMIVESYIIMRRKRPGSLCSLTDITEFTFGRVGSLIVSTLVVLEFGGTLAVNSIFLWKNIQFFSDELSQPLSLVLVAIVSSAVVVPSVWSLRFHELWVISLLGLLATIMITLLLSCLAIYAMAVPLCDNDFPVGFWCGQPSVSTALSNAFLPEDGVSGFAIAIGIFILSLGGHAALPSVYSEMRRKQDFNWVMNVSFTLMFFIYTVISVAGWIVYGNDVNIIVSNDILWWPGGLLAMFLTGLIIANVAAAVSPVTAILCEIPETALGWEAGHRQHKRAFRTLVYFFVCVCSYFMVEDLDVLEAVTGSFCTIMTTFVLPAAFVYKLSDSLTATKTVWIIILMGSGVIIAFAMSIEDLLNLGK